MKQAKEYEERAEMAERQARNARDPTEREAFLEIAKLWRRLAHDRYGALRNGE
jgi:hypothetical protein